MGSIHLKQGGWKYVDFSPGLVGVSSQGSIADQSSQILRVAT